MLDGSTTEERGRLALVRARDRTILEDSGSILERGSNGGEVQCRTQSAPLDCISEERTPELAAAYAGPEEQEADA
eukprot:7397197-Heterocapsa_arctica.AAC.1